MGDRANVLIQAGEDKGIYFYTHWRGCELPLIVQNALSRKLRLDDEAYLNRIIFCEMIKGDERAETGFGISEHLQDGEDRIIHIDPKKQTVTLSGATYSFDEYIKLDPADCHF